MSIGKRYRRWRRYRAMVRELQGYSPVELKDLGISRVDIDRVAFDAVYRYRPDA